MTGKDRLNLFLNRDNNINKIGLSFGSGLTFLNVFNVSTCGIF